MLAHHHVLGAAVGHNQIILEEPRKSRNFKPQNTLNTLKSLAAVALLTKASVFALSFQL